MKLDFNVNSGGYVVIFPTDRTSEAAAATLCEMIDGAVDIFHVNFSEDEQYYGVLIDMNQKEE